MKIYSYSVISHSWQFLSRRWSHYRKFCNQSAYTVKTFGYKNESNPIDHLPEFKDVFGHAPSHAEIYKYSIEQTENFWSKLARSRLFWQRDFNDSEIVECDMKSGIFKWFGGGQLNAAENCIDVHAIRHPERIALIWEKDEPGSSEKLTYKELQQLTCRISNVLLAHGIAKGDPVCIYMPVSPVAVAAMLACARIGAVHSVVFAGFSSDALAARIQDASCKIVITANEAVRGGKKIDLKRTVDAAVQKCPTVKRVFVYQRTETKVSLSNLDILLDQEMAESSDFCKPATLDSEDFLFMLYTSGSTGQPKGIAHTQAGYLLYASLTHKLVFDYQDGDIYACVADIGWITGHSYVVYGPLCNGATSVLFESTPLYPDPGRYWEMVERLKINQFYGAPTAIRQLLKYGESYVEKYDRSTLKTLGTVGEPINHEAWQWYNDVVGEGRCSLVDTWWQTETGGIMIAPRPADAGAEILASQAMRPFYGIVPALVTPGGEESSTEGALCVARPWPSMARTIWGHHDRFLATYYRPYPGYYFSGDGAVRDRNGYYHITGRMDDVINVSGHRLGTAEIEDALDEHPDVAETAVVGFPHSIKGEGIYVYITLKERVEETEDDIIDELNTAVVQQIGKFAAPDHFLIVPGLPKTRSGKIMRRLLKKIAAGQSDLGDVSTLAEPGVVNDIINKHKSRIGVEK